MAVRSDRLGGAQLTVATIEDIFTVPAGETWLVKRAVAHNNGLVSVTVRWYFEDPGSDLFGLWGAAVTAGNMDDHETWWALDAGCVLQAYTPAGLDVRVSVFGAKLLGVA